MDLLDSLMPVSSSLFRDMAFRLDLPLFERLFLRGSRKLLVERLEVLVMVLWHMELVEFQTSLRGNALANDLDCAMFDLKFGWILDRLGFALVSIPVLQCSSCFLCNE